MKINRKKLPVKYALDVYTEAPGFPTDQDFEYITVAALEERGLLGSEFSADQVWDAFKYYMGTIDNLRDFLDRTFDPEDERDRLLSTINGTKPSTTSYQVHDHAWSDWS
jgi:hypothetical protein